MGRGDGNDAYTGADADADELPEHTVTVSSFYLDTFEVTVGRFRRFVAQYDGSAPAPGTGAHQLHPSSGWQSAWNASMPASQAALAASLKCDATMQQWTDTPGSNELHPITCVSWYEAFAFCAWDGGRLPTETELEYAAAGGTDNRLYPWGAQAPDNTRAVFNCQWGGSAGTCQANDLAAVGSAPAGAARYGHHDLAGSTWEWALDWYDGAWYTGGGSSCNDCLNLTPADTQRRSMRCGSYDRGSGRLRAAFRNHWPPEEHYHSIGLRCARSQ